MGAEAIRSAIHVVLLLLRSTCDMVHCFGERAFFRLHLWLFFGDFFLQTHQSYYIIFAIDGSFFLKVIEQNALCIPKYGDQNLAC